VSLFDTDLAEDVTASSTSTATPRGDREDGRAPGGRPAPERVTPRRPIMALFDLVGRRWTLRVIWELHRAGEPLSFRELRARCGDVSSSVLTRRLAELRDAALVDRASGYRLTALGEDLVESLEPVTRWAERWARAR
jgi:DNA-binding HxlR family transcriptional regulator